MVLLIASQSNLEKTQRDATMDFAETYDTSFVDLGALEELLACLRDADSVAEHEIGGDKWGRRSNLRPYSETE